MSSVLRSEKFLINWQPLFVSSIWANWTCSAEATSLRPTGRQINFSSGGEWILQLAGGRLELRAGRVAGEKFEE